MKGRIPNWIKERAKEEIARCRVFMAHHYACYNTDWSGPDPDDLRLIRAIEIIGRE